MTQSHNLASPLFQVNADSTLSGGFLFDRRLMRSYRELRTIMNPYLLDLHHLHTVLEWIPPILMTILLIQEALQQLWIAKAFRMPQSPSPTEQHSPFYIFYFIFCRWTLYFILLLDLYFVLL